MGVGQRSLTSAPSVLRHTLALFVLALAILAGTNFALGETPRLEQIVVVFKTHFDIGYTDMASNVVQRYRTSMMEKALEVVDQNRDLPAAQQFVWTLAGWPTHKILEDWPGQSAEQKQRVEKAIKEGRFVVHALPFTTHTELLEAEDLVRGLGYSSRILREQGLDLARDGKMTDVPEHTWMMATLLKKAGVDFMMIGCNGACAPLKVPLLFWWEGPDGSRVLTMYSPNYGTQLEPPADWPYKTWLACLHTGDNHGPPRPDEVKKVLDRAAKQFPGVKVRIGRMSDFGDAILAEKPQLPIVRGDAPDTWIHGPMSDPAGAKLARNTRPLLPATEGLNTQLRTWGVAVPDAAPAISAAYEQSLLYGEHTWGGAIYWLKNRLSYGEAFKKERADGRFERIEGSWEEHTAYIRKAQALVAPELEKNLAALAQSVGVEGRRIVVYNPLPWKRSGLVSVKWSGPTINAVKRSNGAKPIAVEVRNSRLEFFAADVPAMGYCTYLEAPAASPASHAGDEASGNVVESPFLKATLDPSRGVVLSLVDKHSGRELVDASASVGLGQYLYERFDLNHTTQYCKEYVRPGKSYPDFYKPGLPSAEKYPYQATSPRDFNASFERTPAGVTASMKSEATAKLPAVTTRLILYADQPCADLEITLHDKPADPWPEAGWLCLPFKVEAAQFHLGRVGSIIDPVRDTIPGANRNVFGINSGLAVTSPQGVGVGLCAMDYPLVSLETSGCWKYRPDFVPKKPLVYINLFNNQWDTNFRLWNEGTWTSRVRIWSVGHYKAERSLITPSLEARFPLQAAVGEGAPGKLPLVQQGLELGRKGILITAFGANPDGKGTVLRLWEYAGSSGPCKVRLPSGIDAGSVQPVDLRGRPAGKPIAVRNHTFVVNLDAFTPASLVMGD